MLTRQVDSFENREMFATAFVYFRQLTQASKLRSGLFNAAQQVQGVFYWKQGLTARNFVLMLLSAFPVFAKKPQTRRGSTYIT
jgi:hypothetical protein